MAQPLKYLVAGGLILCLLATLVGCGEGEPPVSEKTKQQQSKLSEIRTRTGFDYSKATDEDKKFLMDACNGDEGCAKQLLFKPKPGGPANRPTPGQPPAGPPPAVGG